MKKIIIALMLGIFLIGIVNASYVIGNNIYFDNFNEAEDYVNTINNNKQDVLDNFDLKYNYTSDKVCEYDFDTEEFFCSICYEIQSPIIDSDCVSLLIDSTQKQDDERVLINIKNKVYEDYVREGVKVNLRDEKGRNFK